MADDDDVRVRWLISLDSGPAFPANAEVACRIAASKLPYLADIFGRLGAAASAAAAEAETVTADASGDFGSLRTEDLAVTGKDGYGKKTPTVRELARILRSLPGQVQDLPVARYCDEGVAGISYDTSYPRENGTGSSTTHVALW